jgi:protein involved in polysaccharide export with SLBB domain
MEGSMGYPGKGHRTGWPLALALVCLTGCSTTPGRGFTLFPEGHRLIDPAKDVRSAMTEPVPLPRELDKRVLPPYVIEPGDVVLVQPADFESPVRLPGDQTVLQDGTISLGRYGRIVVAGQTLDGIERMARAAVEAKTKNPGPIVVRLVTRVSKVFYVLGEVNSPGSYPLAGRETVLDAILAGGGLTDRASRRNIILSRPTKPAGCRVVLPICYNEIVQLGDTSTNYQVMPGDRIYVPTRSCWDGIIPPKYRKDCPPCGRAHVPCTDLSCGAEAGGGHPAGVVVREGPVQTGKAPLRAPPAALPAGPGGFASHTGGAGP